MIDDLQKQAKERMEKCLNASAVAFSRIRTGRAHPSLLDRVKVSYYGTDTPLNQVANITVEDGRTLSVRAWERNLIPQIEKAILKSNLGLNPVTTGEVIRIPLPALTEEMRKEFGKQAKHEAENSRIAVRNVRRDIIAHIKNLLKDKQISEDEEHRHSDSIQKITDQYISLIDQALADKETELMAI